MSFVIPQQTYSSYNSVAEALAADLLFAYGLIVYIIPENKFYYWDVTFLLVEEFDDTLPSVVTYNTQFVLLKRLDADFPFRKFGVLYRSNGVDWFPESGDILVNNGEVDLNSLQLQINGKQPLDADLTAIAALSGTAGFLKTDGAGTWWIDVGGSGSVSSVFGRTGIVIALAGDYDTSLVTENTNLYFTTGRVDTQVATYTGDVTLSGTAFAIGTGKVTNLMLVNDSITINGTTIALGGSNTITANLTNALTVDNSSLELNVGTTFNGSIAKTISVKALGITNSMLVGSIAASKLVGTDIVTVGTVTSGTWQGTKVGIAYGGTNAITASDAINNLLPSQVGNNGKYLTTDGINTSWATIISGVTSVNGGTGAVTITITGTSNRISVSGGTGLTPIIDISATYIGQTSITTLGIITTGVWNGTAITNANLANSTITIAGTLTTLGSSITLDTITGVGSNGYLKRAGTNTLTNVSSIGNSDLTNSSITINGNSTSLGGTVTITVTGTSNRISVSGGTGLTPAIDIAATYIGQTSITTLGTIVTGVWNGTAIANANLANSSITINGTLIALGASGTITANLSNVLTVDNSSLEYNSGTTFDGSVAKTISVKALGITNAMLGGFINDNKLTSSYLYIDGTRAMTGALQFKDAVINTNDSTQKIFGTSSNILYLYTGTSGLNINNQANSLTLLNLTNTGTLTLSSLATKGLVTNTISGVIGTIQGTGFVKDDGNGNISYDNLTYLTTSSAASLYQPLDSDLTTIASLTATTDNFLVSVSSAWASRTPIQVKTTLSLNNVENTALSTWAGSSNLVTLGTITSGLIGPAYGGTGIVNNALSTLTISGSFGTTLTVSATTALTLPTSGTVYSSKTGSITSASLLSAMSDPTGTGASVFATIPTLTNPILSNTATSTTAGQIGYDGVVPYFNPLASRTALVSTKFFMRQHATYTLTSTTSVQQLFNGSANGAVALGVGTYNVILHIFLSSMSSTSGNSAFSLVAGTATLTNVLMQTIGTDTAPLTTPSSYNGSIATTTAFGASMQTAGTGTQQISYVVGSFEVSVAGTVIPSIALVTAAAAVNNIGSRIEFEKIGLDTVISTGTWT